MFVENVLRPSEIKSMLSKAIEKHKNGDIKNSKDLYLQILEADSHNYNALHMLGVIASAEDEVYDEALVWGFLGLLYA
jgi:hypothetical protein